jgi:hypothetical protein
METDRAHGEGEEYRAELGNGEQASALTFHKSLRDGGCVSVVLVRSGKMKAGIRNDHARGRSPRAFLLHIPQSHACALGRRIGYEPQLANSWIQ